MTHEPSPIAFAHRGGKAHNPENSMAAFRWALRAGATGIETDVWLSADHQPMLSHEDRLHRWIPWRRQRISTSTADELPGHVPTLAALYQLIGGQTELFIDVKDPRAAEYVVEQGRSARANQKLWLAHGGKDYSDWRMVASWRSLDDEIKLVDSTTVKRFDLPAADYAKRAVEAGIQVINLPAAEWTPALHDAFRLAGLTCFGFAANKVQQIEKLAQLGLDGIHSDHVDRLVDVLGLQPADFRRRPNP